MFRFAFVVLALIGLGVLLFGAAGLIGVGLAFFVVPLIFLAKIAFFVMFFGFLAKTFAGRPGDRGAGWCGPGRTTRTRTEERSGHSREEQFDEWHRMAHAREEVDSWVEFGDE